MRLPELNRENKQIRVDVDGPFEPVARLFDEVESHSDTVTHLISRLTQVSVTAFSLGGDYAKVLIPTAAWFVAKRLLGYTIQFATIVSPDPIELELEVLDANHIGTS